MLYVAYREIVGWMGFKGERGGMFVGGGGAVGLEAWTDWGS